ncbi:hypothetical protein M378DRAFT_156013 [Amanita muscaria Koide BX008]|uniref:Uncharacterized protein n=1 Tax=Amanita muscaria (strain Koide BX008) TaxID=946122 RepID=A0A0C2T580_AMAMK|nr:hypothetical protein M378DRAFT_156013 [Amanita muscaria Koide BX008]
MGGISIVNNTSHDIYVSVTQTGGDFGGAGSEKWFTLKADGGTDTWGSRNDWQVIRFTRSQKPGVLVETILGIPGKTVNIY